MQRERILIIGNGPVGGRLVEELLDAPGAKRLAVTVVGEEPHGCYNRILLSKVLGGAAPDEILLRSREWYESRGVTLISGVKVERLDTAGKLAHLSDGSVLPYDAAVFATGSRAWTPPTDGLLDRAAGRLRPGAFVFRTVEDCLKVRQWAKPGMKAAVVGGGLLGLEAAKGLHDLGLRVTVVHLADRLMERQLDPAAGEMLRRSLEGMGIAVRTNVNTRKVLGVEKVTGLWFAEGDTIDCDIAVFACGIRPRVETAEASGIPVNKGIVVDDRMASGTSGIYAVGECAEHRGTCYGIVSPLWDQAKVLADVLAGSGTARFAGAQMYTRLKVAGVEVAGMGLLEPAEADDEVLQVSEPRRNRYRKLILRNGRLVGAMLVGDSEAAATLLTMFNRGTPLPENRLDVLATIMPAGSAAGATDVEVCNCHKVCAAEISAAIKAGCRTLEAVGAKTRAGTGCGSCRGQLATMISTTPVAESPAALNGSHGGAHVGMPVAAAACAV